MGRKDVGTLFILVSVIASSVGSSFGQQPVSAYCPPKLRVLSAAGDTPGARSPRPKFSSEARRWIDQRATWPVDPDGARTLTLLDENEKLSDSDLAALRLVPEINSLRVMCYFSNEGLANLKGLSSIEHLHLEWGVEVTDGALRYIATMPNLHELEILQTIPPPGDGRRYVDDMGVVTLSDLPHLQILKLYGAEITERGLLALRRFPELRELRLASPKLTWDSIESFPKLGKLEVFEFRSAPRAGEREFDEFDYEPQMAATLNPPHAEQRAPRLATLGALSADAQSRVTEYKKWPADADGKWLLEIKENDAVSDSDLLALRQMPNVNRVRIYHAFTASGAARLAGLKNVKFLTLGPKVDVNDDVLRAVAQMPNLIELQVVQDFSAGAGTQPIDDDGIAALSKLPNLKVLTVRGASVTEKGLARLKDFPELRAVRLGRTKLTWDCLARFPKLAKLEMLELSCPASGPTTVRGAK